MAVSLGLQGFMRPSARVAWLFLCLWTALILFVWAATPPQLAPWLTTPVAGDRSPLELGEPLLDALMLWVLLDLFWIRRAPPEWRKAQYGTSVLTVLLLLTTGGFAGMIARVLRLTAGGE